MFYFIAQKLLMSLLCRLAQLNKTRMHAYILNLKSIATLSQAVLVVKVDSMFGTYFSFLSKITYGKVAPMSRLMTSPERTYY